MHVHDLDVSRSFARRHGDHVDVDLVLTGAELR